MMGDNQKEVGNKRRNNNNITCYDDDDNDDDANVYQDVEEGGGESTCSMSDNDVLHSNNDTYNDDKTNVANIFFRNILPEDRIRIQELFEEWFPVDYKDDFYDDLCNHSTMGAQDLYTLVATKIDQDDDEEERRKNPSDPLPPRIIACLLGCKLKVSKLNEASRDLLIPGYRCRHPVENDDVGGNSSSKIDCDDNNEIVEQENQIYHNKNNNTFDNSSNIGDDDDDENENNDDDIIEYTDVFYIMTLGVVEEEKRRGLASYLLERALADQIVVVEDDHGDDNDDEEEAVLTTTIEECSLSGDFDNKNNRNNNYNNNDAFYEFSCDEDNAIYYDNEKCNHNDFKIRQTNRHNNNNNRRRRCCETAYLHVIITNDAAIRFYEKLGFYRLREIPNYYTINDEKYDCYLYVKFFNNDNNIDEHGGIIAATKTVVSRWITSIWSSISYYWIDYNSTTIVDADKTK